MCLKVIIENRNLPKNFNLENSEVQNDLDLDQRLVDIMNMIWGMCIPSINIIGIGVWKL